MKQSKVNVAEILLFALALLMAVGSLTFFKSSCGEEMHCHQANTVVTVLSAVLLIFSVVIVSVRGRLKSIFSFLSTAVAVVTALIPGVLMPLCMMPEMSCRAVMKPWTVIFSAVIAAVALINGILRIRKS